MKRDQQLRAFSSDHHRMLVMARQIDKACNSGKVDSVFIEAVEAFCFDELSPHFTEEENNLLPILEQHGEKALVARTIGEHTQMMEMGTRLEQKNTLQQFSQLMKLHVWFEEKVLFNIIQEQFSDAELNSICS